MARNCVRRPVWRFLAASCFALGLVSGCAEESAIGGDGSGQATFDIGNLQDSEQIADSEAPLDVTGLPELPEKDAPAAEVTPKDGTASCIEGGCPCSENGQCESGYCLDDAGTGVCAFKCAGGCPSGTSCKTVAAGADTVEVCLPKFPRICDPCHKDSDCQGGAAGTAALCVDYGDGQNSPGKFCGGACDDKSPCPTGYTCAQVKNAAGALVKQCKREDLTCPCSPRAAKLGLATTCSSTNTFGTCSGQRFCEASGLSACGAIPAKAELCDGVDNDCDAQTDEAACDDKNPCTTDACDPINKKCTNTPTTASCDDGSVCTSKDSCKDGLCTGTAKNCDDGEVCTEDTCDSKTGCKNEVLTGPCATDNPCETGAQCKGGVCQGAKPKVCNDGNQCTADSCLDGKCQYKPLQVPCDDGNVCTTSDVCESAACIGKGKICADNNPCTEDTCNPSASGGCQFSPVGASCDDGNACTTKDFCVNGACAGSDNKCIDGKPCTLDSCDPAKGCVNTAVSGACDDGNPCTAGDTCNASTGACTPGSAAKCDDANGCTTDACDPSKGCVHSPATANCDDGDACTQGDTCKDGKCGGGANKCGCQSDTDCAGQGGNLCLGKLKCDKSALPYQCKPDPLSVIACNTASDTDCKKTSCDPANGQCVSKAVNESGLCSDGNACTIGDTCTQGVCKAQGNKSCEDNNACTNDSCVPSGAGAGCQFANNSATCNDGDACTKNDSCSGGQCKGMAGSGCCGVNSDCDDKNPCTVDTCDAKTGACKNDAPSANGQSCAGDGNGCTVGDVCQSGQCVTGKAADCSTAADACNDGVCNSTGAATYQCTKKAKANNATCDDGKFCTTGETCQNGSCTGGKVLDCAASGCTTGVCDEAAKGCKGTPKADGASCDADGSGCTKDDQCVGGKCIAGVKIDCSNPFDVCNDIACNSTGAVSYQCKPTPKAKGAPCEDGKFCTDGDGCDGAGKCLSGGPTDCSSAANACNDATCDEAGKTCVPKAKGDGATCNDGDTCTATDTCKAGQCVGSNNACGDFKISMAKTVGVSLATAKTPALVDMGAGRFRFAWGNTDSVVALRSFRGDWSREYTEQTYGTPFTRVMDVGLFPSGVGGINDLLTGATYSDAGSCSTYYNSSCNTTNGCATGSYVDCGNGYCTKYRYNARYDFSWQRYDALDALSGGKTTLGTSNTSCTKSDVSSSVLNSFVGAGSVDGKRLIAHNYAGTISRKLFGATGAVLKDLGTENGAKNYDVALGLDGSGIFVWDDGAEIWAQMYYSDGSTNGNKFQVNTKTVGAQTMPRVAFQPSGRYIIAWNTDQGSGDVAVQVFKPDPGSFLGQETTVNTTVSGVQSGARIGVFQDGSFVVAFEDSSAKDGAGYGILGQWFTSSGGKSGSERVINATTPGDQRYIRAQGLSSDEVVVAWTNLADGHVYARKFDKAGTVVNGAKEVVVNTSKTGEQASPALAVASNGAYAVVWDSEGLDSAQSGIALQRYAADGTALGTETLVNTFKAGAQITPSIGMDTAGNFAVAWDSIDQDGDIDGIYAQRFKNDGSKGGSEFKVSQTSANEQQKPSLAMLGDGSFAVAWESYAQAGGANYDVMLRCFDASGAAQGDEQIVNSTVTDKQQSPHVVAFPDGRYLVVWQSFGEDGAGWGVYGQLLYKDCKAIGGQFQIHTTKPSDQTSPRAAVDANGAFVVVWSSLGQDGDNYGIYAQQYDKNGGKVAGEFKANAWTAGEQSKPTVAYLPGGNFVVVWQTVGEDEASYALKAAQFKGTAQQGLDWVVNTTFASEQVQPAVVGRFNGSWITAWKSLNQDGSKGTVVTRTQK